MGEWGTVLDKLGWPAAFCIAITFFFYKKIWPFLISQMEYYQAEMQKTRTEFLQALARRDTENETISTALEANPEAMRVHTQAITSLATRCKG